MQRALSALRVDGNRPNFPAWYQTVVREADMAEASPVRGSMIIKPWGYGVWEQIQKSLDARIKATGHDNCYFPLFIRSPSSPRKRSMWRASPRKWRWYAPPPEDDRRQAAARSRSQTGRAADRAADIGNHYWRCVLALDPEHRDLPLLINQWANVVRWEMRTRLFLRTSEFLWQEGHTAHADADDAMAETLRMLEVYREFSENILAMPVIAGEKSANERFRVPTTPIRSKR